MGPDPEEVGATLAELHQEASVAASGCQVELYHRIATTVRVARGFQGRTQVIVGTEGGLAVRTRSAEGRETGFSACSGMSRVALDWALSRAQGCRRAIGEEDFWPSNLEERQVDHDSSELPPPAMLDAWLGRAWERLGGKRPRPTAGQIEVAATVESWVADGFSASRSRVRAWAWVELTGATPPILVAARRFELLVDSAWADVLDDRGRADEASERWAPAENTPLLFNPESAAKLVQAVVIAQQATGHGQGTAVGPGWEIADDPLEPKALFGGTFDDAGYRTSRQILADGRNWTGRTAGKGHCRRPSFRDPPAAVPSALAVVSRPEIPPPRYALVSGLVVHILGPQQWILEIDAPGVPRGFVRTSPGELASRCAAAVGPARSTHLGICTPALLFTGLTP